MSVETSTSAAYTSPPQPAGARRSVEELCAIADVSDDAAAVARQLSGRSDRELIEALCDGALATDAIRVLAHRLPKREAVWWAWVCARKAAGGEPAPMVRAALEAVEHWIMQPTEEHRRAAMRAAEVVGYGTPAGCAALAAFLSSGSLGPPQAPPVPPGEFMTAKAVAGSVTLAAVSGDAKTVADRLREFVSLGMQAANRIGLWVSPPPA